VVPDLVIEVLSAKTSSRDRGEKKAIYERNGVREYWLVDWRSRTVTVFSLGEDGRYDLGRTHEETEPVASSVLAGLGFLPRELFPTP
jgi:Uma2 family endonuclease